MQSPKSTISETESLIKHYVPAFVDKILLLGILNILFNNLEIAFWNSLNRAVQYWKTFYFWNSGFLIATGSFE